MNFLLYILIIVKGIYSFKEYENYQLATSKKRKKLNNEFLFYKIIFASRLKNSRELYFKKIFEFNNNNLFYLFNSTLRQILTQLKPIIWLHFYSAENNQSR